MNKQGADTHSTAWEHTRTAKECAQICGYRNIENSLPYGFHVEERIRQKYPGDHMDSRIKYGGLTPFLASRSRYGILEHHVQCRPTVFWFRSTS